MTLQAQCEALGILVPIKLLSTEQLDEIITKLVTEITKKAGKPVKMTHYYRWLISNVLVDSSSFFDFVAKDPIVIAQIQASEEGDSKLTRLHVAEEIATSMYDGIAQIYPVLNLENIFTIYNKRILKPPPRVKENKTAKVILSSLESLLRENIVGQEQAISAVVNAFKSKLAGLSTHMSLFFVGPTGVGKTQIAKLVASIYDNKFIKINCSELTHGHEHHKYIGSPPGFVGHSEKSFLKEKADKSSEWVFLFDEIEKADHKFFDFLLNLLDDGTVIDNLGETLNFKNSIFIFTSNEGTDNLKSAGINFNENVMSSAGIEETIKKSMESKFRPEFLNRIDEIVVFNQLTEADIKSIISLELKKYPIVETTEIVDYILSGGYSVKYGVRNIERFLRKNVKPILAEQILDSETESKSKYIPILKNNKLSFSRINDVVDREIQGKERAEKRRKTKAS